MYKNIYYSNIIGKIQTLFLQLARYFYIILIIALTVKEFGSY